MCAVYYEKADKSVTDLMHLVIAAHQPCLARAEVTVDVLMAIDRDDAGAPTGQPAVKLSGYPCAATVKINSLKDRVLGMGDALVTIDEHQWEELTDEKRRALLDHELEHLEVARVGGGVLWHDPNCKVVLGIAKTDDIGRPRLKMRLHDWQLGGFRTIARRWGEDALEVHAVRACKDAKTGQYWWDFALTPPEAPPEKAGTKPAKKPKAARANKAALDLREAVESQEPQIVVMYSEAEKALVDQVARIRRVLSGEHTARDLKFRDEIEMLYRLIPDDGETITVGKFTGHEVTLGRDERAAIKTFLDDNPAAPAGDEE